MATPLKFMRRPVPQRAQPVSPLRFVGDASGPQRLPGTLVTVTPDMTGSQTLFAFTSPDYTDPQTSTGSMVRPARAVYPGPFGTLMRVGKGR